MSVNINKFREQGGLLLEDRDKARSSITEYDGPRALTGHRDRKFNFELVDYYVRYESTKAIRMDTAGAVALGLTEVCMQMKRGKIFWIPKPDSQERSVNTAYYEIPELLYVDYGWSDMDVTVWKKLSHLERLTALNCRAGGLDFDEVVIAISMRFARAETELIHLNATPKCHLALFIDHEVHMGRYADLLNDGTQDAGRAQNVSSAYNRPTNRVNKGDKQEYRYYSLLYMMDAIDDYLYTCQSPLSYKIVAEGIIDAHHKWNQQRMAASNLGNNDSANAVRLAPQA